MPSSPLGRTLVIANPVARSGAGAQAAEYAARFLKSYAAATRGFEIRLTSAPGDARRMAEAAVGKGFDTVAALGGDGVIHEVACGLMALPAPERPQLAIIPMGSGNDYARTLGMARDDVSAALGQLVRGRVERLDVGRVNGVPFVQTLSFGLDSAIALDTTARRAANTRQRGEALFVTSGIKILARSRTGWDCTARFEDGDPVRLCELIFAVQVGPTYGGGFRICPDADPADGLLDVCYNVSKPSIPRILALFALARSGRHAGSRAVRLLRARRIRLEFASEPPVQVDGERLGGTSFDIGVEPGALRVVMPRA